MWRIIARALRHRVVTVPLAGLQAPAPPGAKGRLHLNAGACTGCGKCAEACPTRAITLGPVEATSMGNGTAAARLFQIDHGACIFCGRCVEACTPGAIRQTADFALSTLRRDDLVSRTHVVLPVQG